MDLALFDFDGTISHKDTFTPFMLKTARFAQRKLALLQLLPYIAAYKLAVLPAAQVRPRVFAAVCKGMPLEQAKAHGIQHAQRYLSSCLRPAAMQQIQWHKARGDRVVVVSASLDLYLQPWCELHQLELLCSEAAHCNGKLTGDYLRGDCSGDTKKKRVQASIDLACYPNIWVYGDTPEDTALLSLGTQQYYQWVKIYPKD